MICMSSRGWTKCMMQCRPARVIPTSSFLGRRHRSMVSPLTWSVMPSPPSAMCPRYYLSQYANKNLWPVTCDLWPVTCDMWHVTCELWTVTCDLNKNQSSRNCVGDFWHLPNSDHVRMRGLIEREQKKWNNVLATCEKSASLVPVCVQVWQRMNLIIWPVIDFLHRPSHGDDGSCHDTGSRTRSGDVCDGELR